MQHFGQKPIATATFLNLVSQLVEAKDTFVYTILVSGSLELGNVFRHRFIPVTFIITFISLIVTQYKIEKFKKSVDGQSFDNLESIQEGDDRCRNQMNFNVYRIELITAAITFFTKALSILLLWFFPLDDYFYLKILGETLTLLDQVLTLVFSLMFIFKNEKVCSFFKHRSRNLLLCQSPSDFYIQSANSNIYAIYNPKLHEAHEDCLNFDEIITSNLLHRKTPIPISSRYSAPRKFAIFSLPFFLQERLLINDI